jgi:SAM-dependent methyltransferase
MRDRLVQWKNAVIERIKRRGDYLTNYRKSTDKRVEEDPQEAIGGMWDVIGPLQFEYLKKRGLEPHHRMLDIGCGTLRGGRFFIDYLSPEGYTGIDLSPKAIEAGKQLVAEKGLTDKKPRLVVGSGELTFAEFAGQTFDFLLAQSVFTHLKAEHIDECFTHVGKVMKPTSAFYFTYTHREELGAKTWKGFTYPFSFFTELAAKRGVAVEAMTDYDHPRGQKMVKLTK